MSLDGFSMGNLGLVTDMTSAQMANDAEQIAKKESEVIIKDVEEAEKQHGVRRKKESKQNNKNKKRRKKRSSKKENVIVFTEESSYNEEELRNVSIRVNHAKDVVELYDKNQEKIIEVITANDLIRMVSKLNNPSGVLVNKKI